MELPEKYLDKMRSLLKEEYEDYLDALEKPPLRGLSVNTLKISCEEFERIFPFQIESVPWSENGYYYFDDEVTKHPYYHAGLYYIQEPSAMLPASVLPVEEGDVILDGCAAPGGKSLQIACRLRHSGVLISNDLSVSRAQGLLHNIEKSGIRNAYVIAEDLLKLSERYLQSFDKILLDAPCSGEGMFRKDAGLIRSYAEKDSAYYAEIQKKLIVAASKMLKPGGQMVYSTCTFSEEEDEEVVAYLLKEKSDMHVEEINGISGVENCHSKRLQEALKVFPHQLKGEGHFICLLKKDGVSAEKERREQPLNLDDPFFDHIQKGFLHGTLMKNKDSLFLLPEEVWDTKGIRTLRSALLLGEENKYGFIPSQHLAASLRKEDFDACIVFEADDPRVMKYLKGETVQVDSRLSGWVLICVESYPLGFGKIADGVVKNKIRAGSRVQ